MGAAKKLGSPKQIPGLVDVLRGYSSAPPDVLEQLFGAKLNVPAQPDFLERPMPKPLVEYACLDVLHLLDAFQKMQQHLSGSDLVAIRQQSVYHGKWATNFGAGTSAAAAVARDHAAMRAAAAMASDKHCFQKSRGGRGAMKCEQCCDYNKGVTQGRCGKC